MTTKTYENMTVTVTCKESEDTEMMELIKKMNDTKTARERTEEYYTPALGEDKDGWLVKWDDYNIYNLFRSTLMREIERRIIADESRIRSVRENYDEIAGK